MDERLAQRFGGGPAEDPLGRAVVQHDLLRLVDRDDRVHGRFQQARQMGAGSAGWVSEEGTGGEWVNTLQVQHVTWSLLERTAKDDALGRFAILDRFAETYFGTVVRQTMFAEYEQRVHAMADPASRSPSTS